MARAALDWSAADLARASGLGYATVARFESGEAVSDETVRKLQAAFVAEGIAFTNGGGRSGVSYLRKD